MDSQVDAFLPSTGSRARGASSGLVRRLRDLGSYQRRRQRTGVSVRRGRSQRASSGRNSLRGRGQWMRVGILRLRKPIREGANRFTSLRMTMSEEERESRELAAPGAGLTQHQGQRGRTGGSVPHGRRCAPLTGECARLHTSCGGASGTADSSSSLRASSE